MNTSVAKLLAKKNQHKITALTAYSAATAAILNSTELDIILVGDSLGMVFQGHENTLSVTVEEMMYHATCVRRGAPDKFIVVDLPFMSYQVSPEQALSNAGRIIKSANTNAVKLEGASDLVLQAVNNIVAAGIPVMGHLGFTPQSINTLCGYKVQGREEKSADKLLMEAQSLERAGAFAIVLEMMPAELAARITKTLKIPTISCGAGPDCDGQVLVIDDILGLYPKSPKFAKRYVELSKETASAVNKYISEVASGKFPSKEHTF